MDELQAVARNEGLRCKKRLWRERSSWSRFQLTVGQSATTRATGVIGSMEPHNRRVKPGHRPLEMAALQRLPESR